MLKISESELQPGTERPVYPATIKSIIIEDNPFENIVPRITAEEKRAQEKARKEARKNANSRGMKKQGVKNISLVSFGEEEGKDVSSSDGPALRMDSAHDTLKNDPTLRNEMKDERGLPPEMPKGMGEGLSRENRPVSKRKAAGMADENGNASRLLPNSMDSMAFASRIESREEPDRSEHSRKEKEGNALKPGSESDRVKAEIAKVQADLKRLTRRSGESDNDGEISGSMENAKRQSDKRKAKESGAALLAAERAKYNRGGRSIGRSNGGGGSSMGGTRGKRKQDDVELLDVLEGFRSRVRAATAQVGDSTEADVDGDTAGEPVVINGYAGEILEADDTDEGWLSHTLKFRKDATMDQHNINEYEVIDPRAQNMTLEDAKRHEARIKRQSEQRNNGQRTAGGREERDARDRGRGGAGGYRQGRGDIGRQRY